MLRGPDGSIEVGWSTLSVGLGLALGPAIVLGRLVLGGPTDTFSLALLILFSAPLTGVALHYCRYPIRLRISEQSVTGTWLSGKKRSWPLAELSLDPRNGLYRVVFQGTAVLCGGRRVFVVWRQMNQAWYLLTLLELWPEERAGCSVFSTY
jgi:hypothetical protein